MSEEARQKARERMKAYHAKKNEAKQQTKQEQKDDIASDNVAELKRQIEELAQRLNQVQSQPQTQQTSQPQVTARGVIGTYEKYSIDPADYPDPTKRLAEEPRLAPLAFKSNYELKFDVESTHYETKNGVDTAEPRFTITLVRIGFDDQGVPTDKRYVVKRLLFHEDPQAALTVARENGFDVKSMGEREFLNEMRYLRARDWLFNVFWPTPVSGTQARREEVLDNQLVEVYEVSGESPQNIPFDRIQRL